MLSFLSKRVYPTVFRSNKMATRSKFYDIQESGSDLRKTLQKITQVQKNLNEISSHADFQVNDSIEQSLKMYFIYHSNALDGSKLSLSDTIAFLQDDVIYEENSARDHMDALGHAAAMGLVSSALRGGEKIGHSFVCGVNDLLTHHVASSQQEQELAVSGAYKVASNSVQLESGEVHEYVEPEHVAAEMEELFAHCEGSRLHPVVLAAVAHYNFVRIHPFQHGNGRGARVLMNLILQHYDLPPAVIQVESREKYAECLQLADHGDILPFVRFVAGSLLETMELVQATYANDCQAARQIAACECCE